MDDKLCFTWQTGINRLRAEERDDILLTETAESITRQFSSEMMEQVSGYNKVMIQIYSEAPYTQDNESSVQKCKGPDLQGVKPCIYEADVNISTSMLRTQASHVTARYDSGRAEKEHETCLHTVSCTNKRMEGQRVCREHHDQRTKTRQDAKRLKKELTRDFKTKCQRKFTSSPAVGPCRNITTSEGMTDYLLTQKGKCEMNGLWKEIKDMELQESDLLFYIDTEFANSWLIEVGIETAAGTTVIDTIVTYDKPWLQIFLEGDDATKSWMSKQKKKIGWNDKFEFLPKTKTMNAREVAKCLINLNTDHPEAKFLEHTYGNNDLQKVENFLNSGGHNLGWVLGGHIGIGLLLMWKHKLPGFWWLSQEMLFKMIHPGHQLAEASHRALVDAQKMHILFKDMVNDSAVA